ncbi:hypothetical protein HKCCE2091_21160 [Rhodobacterales bacterium HKCCE2091]|nr:hypothetical protein [Rhodobacterales bacterium HKCCE2091]
MTTDKPLGAGLIAFGIAGIYLTLQISVRTFNDDPGPQLFPILGFSLLILCGLGMLVVRHKPAGGAEDAGATGGFGRGAAMLGLMVLYSVGLWQVGFYIATPVMLYAFYHVIAGPRRRVWWRGATYAAAVTAAVHFVFGTFLNTLLPTGSLF